MFMTGRSRFAVGAAASSETPPSVSPTRVAAAPTARREPSHNFPESAVDRLFLVALWRGRPLQWCRLKLGAVAAGSGF
jgi:hypothetical protein